MGLLDLIKSFLPESRHEHKKINWELNPYDDIEFKLPPEAVENPEHFAKDNVFFALQYAYLKTLQDSYPIERFKSEFVVPSVILPDLGDDFINLI